MLNMTTGVNSAFADGIDIGKRGVFNLEGRKLSDDPNYRPKADDLPVILIIDGKKTLIK